MKQLINSAIYIRTGDHRIEILLDSNFVFGFAIGVKKTYKEHSQWMIIIPFLIIEIIYKGPKKGEL